MSNNDQPSAPEPVQTAPCCDGSGKTFIFTDLTWAMLLLRAWVGLRLMSAGIVKFKKVDAGDGSISYNFKNYAEWLEYAYKPFHQYGGFPEMMAKYYTGSLGFLLLGFGIAIFFGITNRLALIAGAAVMLSLSFGLFTLDDGQEIGYIATQFGACVAALALARHNRLMLFGKF